MYTCVDQKNNSCDYLDEFMNLLWTLRLFNLYIYKNDNSSKFTRSFHILDWF